jgi:ABC-type cobalamin/Fe3+-siderophores transport system ATPase subunit
LGDYIQVKRDNDVFLEVLPKNTEVKQVEGTVADRLAIARASMDKCLGGKDTAKDSDIVMEYTKEELMRFRRQAARKRSGGQLQEVVNGVLCYVDDDGNPID